MRFGSNLAQASKLERGLLLALALSEVLQKGGEKIGLLGGAPPSRSPNLSARFLDIWLRAAEEGQTSTQQTTLPPVKILPQRAKAIFISDCLMPISDLAARLSIVAGKGAKGVLICVADPLELVFSFTGHTRLEDVAHVLANTHRTFNKIENVRQTYLAKRAAHKAALTKLCALYGWQFLQHDTSHPPIACLIAALSALSLNQAQNFGKGA